MESDINGCSVTDFSKEKKHPEQGCIQMLMPLDVEHVHFPALTSSTPIAQKDEQGQIPTLQSNDSGFSEANFHSTPASSVRGTPSSSIASSASSDLSSHHLPSQKQPSLSVCDISPIHRKSIPWRSRRYRHSDPGIETLAMRLHFSVDNDNPRQSHSNIESVVSGEKEGEFNHEIEEITSSTEKSLRRYLLQDVLDRSRSSSRSLSSGSDDLETSFQEMSLEESSSESRISPASLNSLSPTFSFPPSSRIRPQSPLVCLKKNVVSEDIRNETLALNHDETSHKLANKTFKSTVHIGKFNPENQISLDDASMDKKLAFATTLSLSPKLKTSDACHNVSSSAAAANETVILDQSAGSDETFCSPRKHKSCSPHHIASSLSPVQSKPNKLYVLTPSPSQASCASLSSPTKSVLEDYESSLRLCKSPLCESPLLKSPIKRNSSGSGSSISVSPFKMRRKMSRNVEKPNQQLKDVKRDLTAGFSLSMPTHFTPVQQRPQPFNINALSDILSDDDDSQTHDSNTFMAHGASASQVDSLFNRRLLMALKVFSPSEPSRLIGRRIGLIKCDIIGELTKQNFLYCLENIYKYLSDSDLMSVVNVSETWRTSLFGDSKSFQRYKRLRQTHRRLNLQMGKENALGKLKDNLDPGITAAKGPLSIVQQQAATPELSSTNSEEGELLCDDTRRICPTCNGMALIHQAENRATCQRRNCAHIFCTLCFSAFHHPLPCKPLFQAASRTDLAGTRKSKKNLKRL